MTKEAYFEELSRALRRQELLPRPVEEDGLLPVEWADGPLCRVTESGAVRYNPGQVDTGRAEAALARAVETAGTVREYMALMEEAPPLRAEGLGEGYVRLAEFNGAVLAGKRAQTGVQFITWSWSYGRTGLCHGHYHMEDYRGAKEDFALRSGLVDRERLLRRGELEELAEAVRGFLSGEGPASRRQEESCWALLVRLPAPERGPHLAERGGQTLEPSM